MSARGRFLSGFVTMVIALAGLVTVGALPAAATDSRTVQYVALGDSYAAGQGAPPYLNDCLQSNKGYPGLLDSEMRIHLRANEACTGARISDVADMQLSALNRGTRLVTLTVGATELNVSAVATACLPGPSDACDMEIARVRGLLGVCPGGTSALDSPLTDLYAQLVDAAPNALVVVTGYPELIELIPGDPNLAIKAAINVATTTLNCVIERAVTATQKATGADIVYVDVNSQFTGHRIGSPVSFINPPGDPDAFHPNAAGYLFGYTAAISAELPPAWLEGQTQLA
jgi:lysophospholipase L1-like esterase